MFVTFALVSSLAFSPLPSDWETSDTVMLSTLTLLSLYDVMNTNYARDHIPGFEEQNPILSKKPSSRQLWAGFIVSQVAVWGTCMLLPNKYRKVIEGVGVGIEFFIDTSHLATTYKISF